MQKLKYLFSILLLFSLIYSCDKIDQPLEKKTPIATPKPTPKDTTKQKDTTGLYTNYSDTFSTTIRKLLIEDFTGHTCGNCPEAAIEAQKIKTNYGNKILIASVHSGGFALPQKNKDGSYATDFRTAAGNAYNSKWKNDIAGNPNGFVSRSLIINNNMIIQIGSWATAVEQLKNMSPDVKMELGVNYDKTTRNLKTMVKTKVLNPLSGNFNLVIYLLQDSIVDWQHDYSKPSGQQDINNYVHRHVLRGVIPSANIWGEEILTSSATGTIVTKNYDDNIIDSKWNISHCSLIAYIYNASTYEIIQAEEIHILKE